MKKKPGISTLKHLNRQKKSVKDRLEKIIKEIERVESEIEHPGFDADNAAQEMVDDLNHLDEPTPYDP